MTVPSPMAKGRDLAGTDAMMAMLVPAVAAKSSMVPAASAATKGTSPYGTTKGAMRVSARPAAVRMLICLRAAQSFTSRERRRVDISSLSSSTAAPPASPASLSRLATSPSGAPLTRRGWPRDPSISMEPSTPADSALLSGVSASTDIPDTSVSPASEMPRRARCWASSPACMRSSHRPPRAVPMKPVTAMTPPKTREPVDSFSVRPRSWRNCGPKAAKPATAKV
mmetsp:Transcript_5454/g.23066  ORF Transcript_5454/g.23066 Transcript_5454/m.23066 type:complete len:225 (-) Transcript_5454:912-1586(-)